MVSSNNLLTNLKTNLFIVLLLCVAPLFSIFQPAYAQINEFKILPSDVDSLDNFGLSVSISGDYAVVGAFGDDDAESISGSVYIYFRDDGSWTQQAKLTASVSNRPPNYSIFYIIHADR